MDRLLTLALTRATVVVAMVVVTAALVLSVVSSARRAAATDLQDVAAVSAVVAVTDDRDEVRAAITRTSAGAQGRLAVHLMSGITVGTGAASPAEVAAVSEGGPVPDSWHVVAGRAVVELSASAPAVDGMLVLSALLLVAAGAAATAAGVSAGRRGMTPSLRGLHELIRAAREHTAELRASGPAELVDLAAMVNGLNERTHRLLSGQRTMAADVSHRLRTPLTALRLDVDALDDSVLTDRIRGAVMTLDRDIGRIIESIESLDALVTTPTRCDLAEVVLARMRFWGTHAANQGRRCEVDVPDRPMFVEVSRDSLAAAVDTVLDNIFQHTPSGSPITVQVVVHAGWITLVVEDGGHGVAERDRATHRGRSGTASTGLGLAIARAAAESTGGSLHVEKGRLGGARIRLRFCATDHDNRVSRPLAWRLARGTD